MAERGEYRSIYKAIVDDPEFQALRPDSKLAFFTLRLLLGPSGIDVARGLEATLVELTGYDRDVVCASMAELEAADWVRRERSVVWIRNALRYEPSLTPSNENHRKSIQSHLMSLPKLEIVNEFARYYGLPVPFPVLPESHTPSPAPSHGDGIPDQGRGKGKGKGIGNRKEKEPPPTSPPSAPAGRGDGWSRRACDAWIAQYSGTAPGGRIGKALKPLISKHGPEPVLKAWAAYLSERDPQYASAQEFAGKYGLWSGNAKPPAPKEEESAADKRARVETQLVAQWLEDHPAERAEIETWAEKLADEKRYPQDGRRRSFVQFNVAGAVKRRLRLTA